MLDVSFGFLDVTCKLLTGVKDSPLAPSTPAPFWESDTNQLTAFQQCQNGALAEAEIHAHVPQAQPPGHWSIPTLKEVVTQKANLE